MTKRKLKKVEIRDRAENIQQQVLETLVSQYGKKLVETCVKEVIRGGVTPDHLAAFEIKKLPSYLSEDNLKKRDCLRTVALFSLTNINICEKIF